MNRFAGPDGETHVEPKVHAMGQLTRRGALVLAVGTGGAALAAAQGASAESQDQPQTGKERWSVERERVMACGFTEAEAECWELVARAAGKFLESFVGAFVLRCFRFMGFPKQRHRMLGQQEVSES